MISSTTFQTSYLNSLNYPENLIPSGTSTYRSTLLIYKQRLDAAESNLCLVDGEDSIQEDFEIPIRDLQTCSGKVVDKKNLHSPEELTRWLGVETVPDPFKPTHRLVKLHKRGPKSRFIYLYAENSRDQLKCTRASLVQILTFYQVMPVYLDFIFVFGAQSDPTDLRFSGFREQILIRRPARGPSIPEIDRSGRNYQLCYNLKGASFKKRSDENIKLDEWSIRQMAIHHQFDVVTASALWIVTKGRTDIQQRYKELTGAEGQHEDKSFDTIDACFRSTLAVHLLFCHWSTEDWRWYIRWLETVIDAESSMAIYGPRGPGYAHKEYRPYHIQDLQYWHDKTNEAVMVLDSNVEVLKALRRFYIKLKDHKDFPDDIREACADDVSTFAAHLDEIIDDLKMQISRAKLLSNIISDRKELVLQHLQGQAAERTEKLNQNLEREAIVMRIITTVTLIYLPATFVSTFFSTDVVKYQNQEQSNGSFSRVALVRWTQVTLPLTTVTLLVAWITYRFAESARMASTLNSKELERVTTATDLSHKRITIRHPFQRLTKATKETNIIPMLSRRKDSMLPLHRRPREMS